MKRYLISVIIREAPIKTKKYHFKSIKMAIKKIRKSWALVRTWRHQHPCAVPGVRVLSCSVRSSSLRPQGLQPARLLHPWDSPGENTGGGCRVLLQGTFPSPGLNPHPPCLLRWRMDAPPLSHLGAWQACMNSRAPTEKCDSSSGN